LRFQALTLLALFAGFVLIRTREDFRRLMVWLVLFALLIGATAEQTGDPAKPLTVAGGGDTNQIELALYCSVGLIAGFYLAMTSRGTVRWIVVAIALFLGFVLFAAGSRGILAGALLAVLYVAVVATGTLIRLRTVVIGGAVVLALLLLGPQLAGGAADRYQRFLFAANVESILGQRSYLYETGLDLAVRHPWGVGSAGYPAVTGGLVYPHNVELELAAEYGLLAAFLFLVIVVMAWRARRRAWRQGLHPEAVTVGALLVVLLFDAQVSHGLNGSRPLWLALGLALALPRIARR